MYFSYKTTLPLINSDYYTTYDGSIYFSKTSSGISIPQNITVFEDVVDEGYKIIASVPGASKEMVSVTYVADENIINLNAKAIRDDFNRNYEAKYSVPHNFNVEKLECSLKNGLLTITIPYEEKSKPKEAKIS